MLAGLVGTPMLLSSVVCVFLFCYHVVMLWCVCVTSQAVTFLNERNGVSLSSIRKWILIKYPETKEKQKASFNSLTIKARVYYDRYNS